MKKILFVTNEPKYVHAWEKTLTSNGFEFDVALSASEALDRAESGHPDIIVLDRTETAPEVLINEIKQNKKIFNIQVIKISPDQSGNPDAMLARLKALLAPKKVLIAEDDRQMADVMAMILTTSGFVVKLTHDGVETLKEIKTWLMTVAAVCIMLYLVISNKVSDYLEKLALLLILGGAIGNLIDRIIHKHVIDFIDVYALVQNQHFHWYTFNIADSLICIGVGLLLFKNIFKEHNVLTRISID